jgi:hypothetical protein
VAGNKDHGVPDAAGQPDAAQPDGAVEIALLTAMPQLLRVDGEALFFQETLGGQVDAGSADAGQGGAAKASADPSADPPSCTIDFNDRASLQALDGDNNFMFGKFTFARNYSQCGVTVIDGLNPPDPRLGGNKYEHYHLSFEDTRVVFCGSPVGPGLLSNGVCQPLDPTTLPRLIANHEQDQVIQLTFDADGDGVPDPFDVTQIDVIYGTLNVGVEFESGSLGVFNDLDAGVRGTRWSLLGAQRVVRVTLESNGHLFGADNIVTVPE